MMKEKNLMIRENHLNCDEAKGILWRGKKHLMMRVKTTYDEGENNLWWGKNILWWGEKHHMMMGKNSNEAIFLMTMITICSINNDTF